MVYDGRGGCGAWRLAGATSSGDLHIVPINRAQSLYHISYTITPSNIHTCTPVTPSINTGYLYNLRHLLYNVRQGARHPYPTQQLIRHPPKAHTSLLLYHLRITLATYSRTPLPLSTKHQEQWDYSLAVWSLYRSRAKQVDGHRMQVDGEKGQMGMRTTRVS